MGENSKFRKLQVSDFSGTILKTLENTEKINLAFEESVEKRLCWETAF